MTHKERVEKIDRNHSALSVARQAELMNISRASVYYNPIIDKEDIEITRRIDELFTDWPIFGTRRLIEYLKDYGFHVGRGRVRRLMHLLGLEAVYPREHVCTSIPGKNHKKYPYLLRGVKINRPNQVWGTDITYIRLEDGFCYLAAIIDWFTRYVISWELSASLEISFCMTTLDRALTIAIPDIHNSDKGSQYTSEDYTNILKAHNVRISMDGRGHFFDNIFTERLWRTVKYEDVYLKGYRTIDEARSGLDSFFLRYNTRRKHESLGYRTPASIYFGEAADAKFTVFGQNLQKTTFQNDLQTTFRYQADPRYLPEPIIISR